MVGDTTRGALGVCVRVCVCACVRVYVSVFLSMFGVSFERRANRHTPSTASILLDTTQASLSGPDVEPRTHPHDCTHTCVTSDDVWAEKLTVIGTTFCPPSSSEGSSELSRFCTVTVLPVPVIPVTNTGLFCSGGRGGGGEGGGEGGEGGEGGGEGGGRGGREHTQCMHVSIPPFNTDGTQVRPDGADAVAPCSIFVRSRTIQCNELQQPS